jgi:hypothetical protein
MLNKALQQGRNLLIGLVSTNQNQRSNPPNQAPTQHWLLCMLLYCEILLNCNGYI